MGKKKSNLLIAGMLAVFLSFNAVTPAQIESFRDVVKKCNPAVVYIEVAVEVKAPQINIPWLRPGPEQAPESQIQRGSGSGFIIDAENGYILTAAHVVKNAEEAVVHLPDGREFEIIDIMTDEQTDIALVTIDAENLPEIPLGDSDAMEIGDWVLAMGSPLGKSLENSVSVGIVSGKSRKTGILGSLGIEDFIQTDAVINRGNSGGPLVNVNGEVVGINSNIISSTGMNAGIGFAVPSNVAKRVIADLEEYGEVIRGWLGVTVASLSDVPADELPGDIPEDVLRKGAAYIHEVLEDGPADEGGIKDGDIITAINGQEVTSSAAVISMISAMKPDTQVECTIIRDGKTIEREVTLGLRPGTGNEGVADVTEEQRESAAYEELGIAVEDMAGGIRGILRRRATSGVRVVYVKPGSLADEFGIETGDIIMEFGETNVENSEQFDELVKDANLQEGIMLNVRNKEGKRKVIIKEY
jgi:serine protease Do